jgi:hypothetical protein
MEVRGVYPQQTNITYNSIIQCQNVILIWSWFGGFFEELVYFYGNIITDSKLWEIVNMK